MKQCSKCKQGKPLEEFGKHKAKSGGLQGQCKQCQSVYASFYYEKNKEILRKKQNQYAVQNSAKAVSRVKQWRRDNVKKASNIGRMWRARNPQKYAAHNAVQIALQQGVLQKQPCEVCGNTKVDAHHEDYSKPLEVNWLCRKHHNQLHQEKKEGSK